MLYGTFTRPMHVTPLVSRPVVVYGTRWCGMTQVIRRFLDRAGIPYQYIDLDLNPDAEAQLQWLTGGYASHPTVNIDGQILIEPGIHELQWTLSRKGYL